MGLLDAYGRPLKPQSDIQHSKVTRSFSFKLNLGNYESADFFCAHSAECEPEDADEVSADLDEFCKDQVMEAIKDFKERRARKEAARAGRTAA